MAYSAALWRRFGVGFLDQDRLTWPQFLTLTAAADEMAKKEQAG